MPEPLTRVLIADDQRVLRCALAALLRTMPGIDVVAVAVDGEDAVAKAESLRPDVVLMDVSMPRLDGLEATRRIAAGCPGTRVVGLSMHDGSVGEAMLRAGAAAYVAKDAPPDQVEAAVRSAADPPRRAGRASP